MNDHHWMQRALALARQAQAEGEVPIGAVLLDAHGRCLAESYNAPVATADPTAHAEIRAIRQGGQRLANYRLTGTTLYVTLEPCPMCLAAIMHARISQLVFGAFDPKTGAVDSCWQGASHPVFHHRLNWRGGVLATEAAVLLRTFFQSRRSSSSGC